MITIEQLRRALGKGKGQKLSFQKTAPGTVLGAQHFGTFALGGNPAAGVYGGAKTPIQFIANKSAPSHASGLFLFNAATSPEKNLLTSILGGNKPVSGTPTGTLWVVDLLVEYGGFSGTAGGAQSTLVPLGTNNLPRYTDGEGVQIYAEVQTALGANAQPLTVAYTSHDNSAQNTPSVNTIASAIQSKGVHTNGPFMPLAAGSRGAKSIQSATLTGSTLAGTFCLILCKPLAAIPLIDGGRMLGDFVTGPDFVPYIPDNTSIGFIFQPDASHTPALSGIVSLAALNPDAIDI